LLRALHMIAAPLFALHYETTVTLNAPPETAFAYLDDFRKLSLAGKAVWENLCSLVRRANGERRSCTLCLRQRLIDFWCTWNLSHRRNT
jgi:hypothetical protein